jgi:hypothetical protein
LKPDNVILFGQAAKVGDPGLCLLVAEPRITPTDEAVGPRFYMAPELEHGRNLEVNVRADIYSLGKLLYWLLSGGVNLPRERYTEPSYRLEKVRAPALGAFHSVLEQSLNVDPSQRYASVADLRTAFDEAVAAYGSNPDTSLMKVLRQIAHDGGSLTEALPQLGYEKLHALIKRAELGLISLSITDLIAVLEIDPRLRNDRVLQLVKAHVPISSNVTSQIMRLYFASDKPAQSVFLGLRAEPSLRTALVECVIREGSPYEVDRLARVGGLFFVREPHLLPSFLERLSPPTKIPTELIGHLALTAPFPGKAALMHRAALEASDAPALALAIAGLAKSDDPGVEVLIKEALHRAVSDMSRLQQAGAAVIISETGTSALRQFVSELSPSDENRPLLETLLELADSSSAGRGKKSPRAGPQGWGGKLSRAGRPKVSSS